MKWLVQFFQAIFMTSASLPGQSLEDLRFRAVTRYINWTTFIILLIVVAVFFIPVPAANARYVDIGIGILLGIVSNNSGTITGTNTQQNKKADTVATGDNTTVNT